MRQKYYPEYMRIYPPTSIINNRRVEAYSGDKFDSTLEWGEEKEQESETHQVADIDWRQMRQTIANEVFQIPKPVTFSE